MKAPAPVGAAVTPSLFAEPGETPAGVIRRAVLSACGVYRYRLTRAWDDARPAAVFVMLNPSTADHEQDDRTVGKCMAFARSWGCGRMEVVNLFAYRSPHPSDLRRALASGVDIIGDWHEHHEAAIREAVGSPFRQGLGRKVVAAWGAEVEGWEYGEARARIVWRMMRREARTVYCLGTTKGGSPKHPLYLPAATPLTPYSAPEPPADQKEIR